MENENEESSKTNEYIDKITLELLLNKNHYSKYLSKTDPKKFDEFREHKSKLHKYSIDIVDITSQLIENPKKMFSSDIEETFDSYVKSIIRYLEMKELENKREEEEEEDMLISVSAGRSVSDGTEETTSTSVWSKERVKKSNISNVDMMMFARKR